MEEPEKIVSQTELDDKAQKLVEEKDADSRLRVYVGPMEKALTAVLLIWAVFQVWANMFGTLGAVKLRTAHIMFLLPLAFTLYPTFKKERRRRRLMPVWDIALIAAAIFSYGYLFMRYDAIARTGRLNSTDVWVGVVCLVVAFEAARRASGNLAIIALIFLSYFAVWGRYIPGTFGTSAFTLKRVIKALVWDTNGVLGTGAGVSATYIFVFVLFGAFLKYSGFSQFINDIALTLVGQTPGGPAKVAVIASALMGMINGSAIANVATTGTITIPLMKKTGYKKDFAAAVEAVASTGGQFTPPIMGAVGFVMAEFMCVSYTKVMLAAAIPAFLYYLSLLYSVHLEAKRLGLSGLSKENIPQAGKVLRERGHLLIPLVVLLALMFIGYTPLFAAIIAIFVTIPVSWIRKETRMDLETIVRATVEGSRSAIGVGISCIIIGVIIGSVNMTSLGLNFGNLILRVVGDGHLFLGGLMVMIMSIILGMGVPTTANYIIMATTCAPILASGMGLDLMAAHMFCFYFGIVADITPPVALAAYAGSAIAKAPPMKTAWNATRLAIAAFIIPYIFAYNNALIFVGNDVKFLSVASIVISATLGMASIASGLMGYLIRDMKAISRVALVIGGLLMVIPGTVTDLAGLAVLVVVLVLQRIENKKDKAAASV